MHGVRAHGNGENTLNEQRVHKSVSGACGLTGFAVAVLGGLAADNPASIILTRALVAMTACYAVGMFIGFVASRAVRDVTVAHAINNPAPRIEDVREAARAGNAESNEAERPRQQLEAA